MKKEKIIFIGLVFISLIINGQGLSESSMKFVDETLSKADSINVELDNYYKTDLSKFWLKNQDNIVGYIGKDYQRIRIRLISIIKNENSNNEYFIYGKSKVKDIVCDFQGVFKITHIREFDGTERKTIYNYALKYGSSQEANIYRYSKGFILAEYLLFENPKQKGSGVFKGILGTYFYIDKEELFFDNLELRISDSYCNNQFIGVWQSYKTKVQKTCNWGLYRIPYSGDLDIGAGMFSPDITKYPNKGWETYNKAFFNSDKEARKKEEAIWW